MIDVDATRLQLFINTYMVSDVNEEFNRQNVKTFDASNLPTCKSEFLLQFRRANYITSLWSSAHINGLSICSPEYNGVEYAICEGGGHSIVLFGVFQRTRFHCRVLGWEWFLSDISNYTRSLGSRSGV
ncbi:uncharacterized protein TNCV_1605471 [Trichonephila clavipes]|nr:uncharacterized protein TNCV_1605471 [Trichonephila clavipes]